MLLLKKLVGLLVMPLGFFFVVALIAALLCLLSTRRRMDSSGAGRRLRITSAALAGAAMLLLYAASTPWLGNALLGALEAPYPWKPPSSQPVADAVVVLGGGMLPPHPSESDGAPRGGGTRFETGVLLMQAGRAPWLVLSNGASPTFEGAPTEGERLLSLVPQRGLDPARVIVTARAATTAEEAERVAQVAAERGFHHVLLVTSARHLSRAAALFRARGLEVTPVPSDFSATPYRRGGLLDLVPSVESLARTSAGLHEWLGRLEAE